MRRHGALGLITLVLLMVLKLGWSEVTDTAEVRDSYCCCCNIVSERKQQGLSCHRESDVYSNLMPVAEVVATSWPQKRHSLDSLPCIVPTDRIVVAMSYNNNGASARPLSLVVQYAAAVEASTPCDFLEY